MLGVSMENTTVQSLANEDRAISDWLTREKCTNECVRLWISVQHGAVQLFCCVILYVC